MSLTEARLTESAGMRGLEAGANRVREDYVPPSLDEGFSDDFNRADGAVGSNWEDVGYGPAPPTVSGNKLIAGSPNTGNSNIVWVTATTGYAQFSQATFTMPTLTSTDYVGLMVRSNRVATAQGFYQMRQNLGGTTLEIRRYVDFGSGGTTVASATNVVTAGTPQLWRIEIDDNETVRCYVDGVLKITFDDSTAELHIPAHKYVGIVLRGTATADNWSGGDLARPSIVAFTTNGGPVTTVNKPAGGAVGDYYVILVMQDSLTSTPPVWTSPGFTQQGTLDGLNGSPANYLYCGVLTRPHDGSEGSTFTVSGVSGWPFFSCFLIRGSGPLTFTKGALANRDAGAPLTTPGVTVPTSPSLGLLSAKSYNGSATPFAATGWTNLTLGAYNSCSVLTAPLEAGATGGVVVTGDAAAGRLSTFLLAVSPTAAGPPTVPGAPVLSSATAGDTTVALVWTAPASGGSAITDYIIEQRIGAGSWTTVTDGTGTGTGYTVTGLTNGTAYDYRVSAVNAVGTGPVSNVLSATPAEPGSGFALVAATEGAGNASITTGTINTTGADLLVIQAGWLEDSGPVIADSKGNTWTKAVSGDLFARRSAIYYAWNPTVGSGHSFTVTNSPVGSVQVYAFSGAQTASDPLDQVDGDATYSTNVLQPGEVTPSTANQLVFTGFQLDIAPSAATVSPSSFTSPDGAGIGYGDVGVGGQYLGSFSAYQIQTTATAVNPTWTSSGGGWLTASIATFKSA
jgi:hypothetical protein